MLNQALASTQPEFPVIKQQALPLDNLLAVCDHGVSALVEGEESEIRLVKPETASAGSNIIVCSIEGRETFVSIEDRHLRDLAPRVAADVAFADLPAPMAMALLEMAVKPVLSSFFASLGLAFRINEIGAGLPEKHATYVLRTAKADTYADILLHLNVDTAELVKQAMHSRASMPQRLDSSDLAVRVDALLWETTFSPQEISDLENGDVVLLPHGFNGEQAVLSIGGAVIGRGRFSEETIILEHMKGNIMSETNEVVAEHEDFAQDSQNEELPEAYESNAAPLNEKNIAPEAAGQGAGPGPDIESGLNVDALEIETKFLLGSQKLSVAELQTLAPGFVFELDQSLGEEIKVLAGGREIACGEIVRIGERLGVRLVRVHGDKHG